jgi:hypothetical protein
MPFFESGLSAGSEYDYHSRQFGVHPGNLGLGRLRLAPILVGSVRQPISKGWAQKQITIWRAGETVAGIAIGREDNP